MKAIALSIWLLVLSLFAAAQEQWDLQRCVTYAMANNISVKEADVQSRLAALQTKLGEAGRLPSLGFGTSAGYNFGRSINPATNSFENRSIFFNNFQLQSSVNLFNWFSQRHAIAASRLDEKAAEAAVDKARNDVALNVAVGYLQALLAHEQVEITRVQIGQTASQLENIRKRVRAGALPELNAIELEAQLARDSATMISSVATYQQNIILLKALLNLDMATPFDIAKPDVSMIPVESLADLQPASVYQLARQNMPQQKLNNFRLQSAQKSIQAARAQMYPTLSAFANVGSRFSSLFPDQSNPVITPIPGKFDTLGFVDVSPGNRLYAVRPDFQVTTRNTPYTRQVFDVNLSQAIGVNLSIPIFSNRQLRTNWERSRLNAEGIRYQLDRDNLTLQTDIYTAYTNALNAQQRFVAAQKASAAAQKAYEFSQKRFDVGLLSTFELLTNQNNLTRSRLDMLSAQYEFVFRMKLLEFYKGQGIRLQ